ncbi:hypothetical protein TEQG_05703 [Trichophyton equinum CBS 127.97]|uniref:Uncharacterized protein n=1 Tax=Trichophyton equinum (strain ATCC MYA-4606 / CBS 127.97) TaxID=559882 RepID=F2PXU0_TRIEC|nr:hypothetical protein TEQG_05703 [Trichophyton equinum CBS 127.97]
MAPTKTSRGRNRKTTLLLSHPGLRVLLLPKPQPCVGDPIVLTGKLERFAALVISIWWRGTGTTGTGTTNPLTIRHSLFSSLYPIVPFFDLALSSRHKSRTNPSLIMFPVHSPLNAKGNPKAVSVCTNVLLDSTLHSKIKNQNACFGYVHSVHPPRFTESRDAERLRIRAALGPTWSVHEVDSVQAIHTNATGL